jgi:hypothetical protein
MFGEDASQTRIHNTRAVMAARRDMIRRAFRLAASASTASARHG